MTATRSSKACAIGGCTRTGKHRVGLRCRVMEEPSPVAGKGKTDALWSVESDIYFCDTHAMGGVSMTLMAEADPSGYASVRVLPSGSVRRVRIKQEATTTQAKFVVGRD